MEGYLNFVMFSLIDYSAENSVHEGIMITQISRMIAIGLIGLTAFVPLILLIATCYKFNHWIEDENAEESSIAAHVDGMKVQEGYRGSVVFITSFFFVRRASFCLTLLYWPNFFWGQIAIQFLASTCLVIFIQWARPLESRFANNMETINEVVTVILQYCLMYFSNFMPDDKLRHDLGYVYLAVVCLHVIFHMSIMMFSSCKNLRLLYLRYKNRGCCCCKRMPQMVQKPHPIATPLDIPIR